MCFTLGEVFFLQGDKGEIVISEYPILPTRNTLVCYNYDKMIPRPKLMKEAWLTNKQILGP
jgi:hypothetical protein